MLLTTLPMYPLLVLLPGLMRPFLSLALCMLHFSGLKNIQSRMLIFHRRPFCRATVPVQHFMAWRIMRFSKSVGLFVFISILSLAQGSLACASAIMGLLSPSIASHVKIIPVADAWLATSVACDVSITYVALTF